MEKEFKHFYKGTIHDMRYNQAVYDWFINSPIDEFKGLTIMKLIDKLRELYFDFHGYEPQKGTDICNALCADIADGITELAAKGVIRVPSHMAENFLEDIAYAAFIAHLEGRTLENLRKQLEYKS